jgi:hypothetical protein
MVAGFGIFLLSRLLHDNSAVNLVMIVVNNHDIYA